MTLIIISPEQTVPNEIETINALFDEGLKIFHLRKPNFSETEYRGYLDLINNEYLNRVMIHSYHHLINEYDLRGIHSNSSTPITNMMSDKKMSKSCHSISEIHKYHTDYDYLFLSPIFDSISKKNYSSIFTDTELKNINSMIDKIVALGGINEQTSKTAESLGFSYISSLGYIWEEKTTAERINNFISIREVFK